MENNVDSSNKEVDRRYYLIRFLRVKVSDDLRTQKHRKEQKSDNLESARTDIVGSENYKYKAEIQIGKRQSHTFFSFEGGEAYSETHEFKSASKSCDLHIFPFERQQTMTIRLRNLYNKEEYGFATAPITPFIKYPHTKHEITVEMIFQKENRSIRSKVAAVFDLELYFLYNFTGMLFLEPVEASLLRNKASLGQMNCILEFKMLNSDYCERTEQIVEGGIRPRWKNYRPNQFSVFNFTLNSVSDDIFLELIQNTNFTHSNIQLGNAKIDLQEETFFKNSYEFEDIFYEILRYERVQKCKKVQEARRKLEKRERQKTAHTEKQNHEGELKQLREAARAKEQQQREEDKRDLQYEQNRQSTPEEEAYLRGLLKSKAQISTSENWKHAKNTSYEQACQGERTQINPVTGKMERISKYQVQSTEPEMMGYIFDVLQGKMKSKVINLELKEKTDNEAKEKKEEVGDITLNYLFLFDSEIGLEAEQRGFSSRR